MLNLSNVKLNRHGAALLPSFLANSLKTKTNFNTLRPSQSTLLNYQAELSGLRHKYLNF